MDHSNDSPEIRAELTDAKILRLLIAIYADGPGAFLEAPRPPDPVLNFIQKADRAQLRGLFMETARTLHRASRD